MSPTIAPPIRISRKRRVTFRFVTKVDGLDEKGVEVSVAQFEGRRDMVANAKVVTIENDPTAVFSVSRFAPFSGVMLARKTSGRFSQKRLEEFATEVLNSLPDLVDASPKFAVMFDPEWSDR